MLRNLDKIYYKPDRVRISQPKLISTRTFFWFTEVLGDRGAFLPAEAMMLCVFCMVPDHEPFLSAETTANWVLPGGSRLEQDDSHIVLVLMPRSRNEREMEKVRRLFTACWPL